MNQQQIGQMLAYLGIHNPEVRGDWLTASCPFAFARHKHGTDKNPSFGIMINEGGKSGYYCMACSAKGRDLEGMLVELQHYQHHHSTPPPMDMAKAWALVEQENDGGYVGHEWEAPIAREFEPWPEWWLNTFHQAIQAPRALDYLKGRGVDPALVHALNLRYDPARDTVGFPFRAGNGQLAGMRGRALNNPNHPHHDYRYHGTNNSARIFLGEERVDFTRPVVLVEGPFDYVSVYRVYPNVLANLTTGLNAVKLGTLACAVQVLCWSDNDLAGEQMFHELRKHLGHDVVRVGYPEEGVKDPGQLDRVQVIAQLRPFLGPL